MGLLAPLFLLGLAAIAVPVILHMIQRERKDEIEFPSLMFLRKVPYRSFRRQRIRHWFLLLLRCAALLLLLFAFARPFIRAAALAAVTDGAREVVVLLDRSYSMSFGDRWDDAQALATDAIDALDPGDRATVILFDGGAQTGPRSTTDRASLRNLVSTAEVGSGVTRYGPALKLAEGIFEASDLPRLEAVLVSDFQRAGVESAVGVRFPRGTVLTPVRVGEDDATEANVSVAGVLFEREYFSGRERIQVSARLTNRGGSAISGLDVALDMEGREVETLTADLPPAGSTTVDFAPVTLGDAQMFGAVRIAPDALPADDIFHFVVSPGQVVTVLVVGSATAPDDANLFLTRALGIGSEPAFDVRATMLASFSAADLADRQVVVLNDTRPPSGAAGEALEAFVEAGGGLLLVSGERTAWPQDDPGLLPGRVGPPADRAGRGGSLGFVDYSHPVFEVFNAPRSGDVTSARFFRFRPVEPTPEATVVARFDDGNPALIERRIGAGRGAALGVDHRYVLERLRQEAGLPAVRPPDGAAPGGVLAAHALVPRGAGPEPGRAGRVARRGWDGRGGVRGDVAHRGAPAGRGRRAGRVHRPHRAGRLRGARRQRGGGAAADPGRQRRPGGSGPVHRRSGGAGQHGDRQGGAATAWRMADRRA